MDFLVAVNQFVDMLVLGSQALDRIADQEADGLLRAEIRQLLAEIIDSAERLRRTATVSPQH